jgi:hypothetical protein
MFKFLLLFLIKVILFILAHVLTLEAITNLLIFMLNSSCYSRLLHLLFENKLYSILNILVFELCCLFHLESSYPMKYSQNNLYILLIITNIPLFILMVLELYAYLALAIDDDEFNLIVSGLPQHIPIPILL